jgi:hypothetical protein
MNYTLFNNYFPNVAETETRTIHVPESFIKGLPAGDYTFSTLNGDSSA